MSAVEKTHHTNVFIGDSILRSFDVPKQKVKGLLALLADYEVKDSKLPAELVHKELYESYSKVGAILQGFRLRDEMTQADLAKKLETSQSAVAAYETGKRGISKKTAIRLAKIFDTKPEAFEI